jgi:hypothetical protein
MYPLGGRREPIALLSNPAPGGPELIAPHIPKAGGTSFRAVLGCVYGDENVENDYGDEIGSRRSLFNLDFEEWSRQTRGEFETRTSWPKAVMGHFWLGKYEAFRPTAFTVVWIREPAERLISMYFFAREHRFARSVAGGGGRRSFFERGVIPLEEMIDRISPEFMNPVTRRFLEGYSIDDLDFVGIVEHYAEDVAELGRTLGWPPVELPHEHRTTGAEYREFRPSAALLRKIRALNEADVEFYHRALELRRRRIAAQA